MMVDSDDDVDMMLEGGWMRWMTNKSKNGNARGNMRSKYQGPRDVHHGGQEGINGQRKGRNEREIREGSKQESRKK